MKVYSILWRDRALTIPSLAPYPGYAEEAEASVHNDPENKPFVHHLKVVDPRIDNEPIAYAKWEVYCTVD